MKTCPCGTQQSFEQCCGPIIQGLRRAETAEQLMRSRYSAYATNNMDYIATSCAGAAQRQYLSESGQRDHDAPNWLSLTILATKQGRQSDDQGWVEFVARYWDGRRVAQLHELSEFHRIDGQWFYVDGQLLPTQDIKISRNDPCPCQSGKKYKKCCG